MLLAPFPNFLMLPAPFSNFLCSLLPDYVFFAPCSLPYFMPCSLLPWGSRVILSAPWLPLTGVHNFHGKFQEVCLGGGGQHFFAFVLPSNYMCNNIVQWLWCAQTKRPFNGHLYNRVHEFSSNTMTHSKIFFKHPVEHWATELFSFSCASCRVSNPWKVQGKYWGSKIPSFTKGITLQHRQ